MKRITVGRALTILSDLDVDTRGVNSEYARGVAEALAHALGYRPGEVARAAGGLLALHEALGRGGKISIGGLGRGGSGRGRGRGAKRTSDELDRLAEQFHAFFTKHPGLRIEQINKQLGTTTKDLALPIRKLIADGTITTKGQKRSTTYFAGKKAKN